MFLPFRGLRGGGVGGRGGRGGGWGGGGGCRLDGGSSAKGVERRVWAALVRYFALREPQAFE